MHTEKPLVAKHAGTKTQKVDWLIWICIGVGILGLIVMLFGLRYRNYALYSDTTPQEKLLLQQEAAISTYGLYTIYLGAVLGFLARELNPETKNLVDRLTVVSLGLGMISVIQYIFWFGWSNIFLDQPILFSGISLAAGFAARRVSKRDNKATHPKWASNAAMIVSLLTVAIPVLQLVWFLMWASEL